MAWPQATDYNAAIQNPQVSFADPDLRQGQAVADLFGLPRPHSGNFADVYQIQCPGNPSWAVKCFTREVPHRQQRYQAISDHLRQTQRAFIVDFHFLEQGIRIGAEWFPILKMRWVEGLTLNQFVADHLDKPGLLDRLALLWLKLAQELREAGMAHGDLQHGNVLLIPGSKTSSLALRLIDYDGLYVPALAEQPSGEVGHPNYQHPQRVRDGLYNFEVDRFSHLVVYTALRCLASAGKLLWEKYDNFENLLFREDDFRNPSESTLLRELWGLVDPPARAMVGHMVLATQGPALLVPLLDEVVPEGTVRPLTHAEEQVIRTILNLPVQAWVARSPHAPRENCLPHAPGEDYAPPTTSLPSLVAEPIAMTGPVARANRDPDRPTALDLAMPVDPEPWAIPPGRVPSAVTAVPEVLPLLPPLPPRVPTTRVLSNAQQTDEVASVLPATDDTERVLIVLPAGSAPSPKRLWPTVREFVKGKPWAVAGGALLAIMTGILLLTQMGSATIDNPARSDVELHIPSTMELRGGDSEILDVVLERHSCEETLEVRVEGLPGGVDASALHLEAPESVGQMKVTARLRTAWPARPIQVSVWANGSKLDEQALSLTVHKRLLPRLLPPGPVILKSGEKHTETFRIDRQGCVEELHVQLTELLPGMSQQPVGAAGAANTLALQLAADAGAQSATKIVDLSLWLGPHFVEQQLIALTIEKPVPSLSWRMPETLAVSAGKAGTLHVGVDRHHYQGPIQLRIEGLPEGVKGTDGTIAADEQSAQLEIHADEGVSCEGKQIKVSARGGDIALGQHTFSLTVSKPVSTSIKPPEKPVRLPAPENVVIPTLDGMQLAGIFYPGPKGKDSPCALVLHELGATRTLDDWSSLALALQKRSLAVLIFEFRGHGGSRNVPVEFWTYPDNRLMLRTKGLTLPDMITYRDFPAAYQTYLANDIAAARSYLDMRNDQGDVNAANLYLIGAGRGATLGVLWLATECYRTESSPVVPAQPADVEAKAVRGAVWLSVEPALTATKVVTVSNLLPLIGKNAMVPTLFVHGKDDTVGAARARGYAGADKPGGEGMHFVASQAVPGTAALGQQLLAKDSSGEDVVVRYVSGLLTQQQLQPWAERDFVTKAYQWNLQTPAVAKAANQPLLQRLPVERVLR
jgi:hypothetical protein